MGFRHLTVNGGDTLVGAYGDDTLRGGEALLMPGQKPWNDSLRGGAGDDSLVGGYGSDTLLGGGGDDELAGYGYGGLAIDSPTNDSGDFIDGGAGEDTLEGSLGDDTLVGGSGRDLMWGGFRSTGGPGEPGNDLFDARTGEVVAAADTIDGEGGGDRAVIDRLDVASNVERITRRS